MFCPFSLLFIPKSGNGQCPKCKMDYSKHGPIYNICNIAPCSKKNIWQVKNLSGIMPHLGVIVSAKLSINVFVYIVISVFSFILNFVLTKLLHNNENRRIEYDAVDLQESFNSFHILIFFI